jgi:hypothetical protein
MPIERRTVVGRGQMSSVHRPRNACEPRPFSARQNKPHTIDEWINLDEYDRAYVLAVQLATMR